MRNQLRLVGTALLFAAGSAHTAQIPPAIEWQQSFGGTAYDEPFGIVQTTDGGYIVAGESSSGISGNKTNANFGQSDYWIVKMNGAGSKQWERSFGGSLSDYLKSVDWTPDGGCILGGWSYSAISGNKTTAAFGAGDYWVVKIDAAGNKQWENVCGGLELDALSSVRHTADGGYILAGESQSGLSGNKTDAGYGRSDAWVVKLATNGAIQWDRCFGGTTNDFAHAIVQTSDGGFILAGGSDGGASGNKTSLSFGARDCWAVKLDRDGNKQWDQSFGTITNEQLNTVCEARDGGYLLGGYSYGGVSGNKSTPGYGSTDYWIIKVDADGNKLWDQTFGGTSNDYLEDMRPTSDGGFILCGWSLSGASGNKTSPTFGPQDCWLVKIDADGNKQWEAAYGGSASDVAHSAEVATDGGYVLAVRSSSGISGNKTVAGSGNADFWVLKLRGPARFDSWRFANGTFHAQLAATPFTNYVFQSSTDLVHWTPLFTNMSPTGTLNFSDTGAVTFPTRFYRSEQR